MKFVKIPVIRKSDDMVANIRESMFDPELHEPVGDAPAAASKEPDPIATDPAKEIAITDELTIEMINEMNKDLVTDYLDLFQVEFDGRIGVADARVLLIAAAGLTVETDGDLLD